MIIVLHSALEYWQRVRLEHIRFEMSESFPKTFFVTSELLTANPRISDSGIPHQAEIEKLSAIHAMVTSPSIVLPNSTILRDLNKPIHFGVLSASARNSSNTACCHLIKHLPHENGFVHLDENLFVATPEYAFVQIARSLSFIEGLQLGYGLCGYYITESSSAANSRLQLVEAITSVDLLTSFLTHNPALYGSKTVRQLIKYLRCGSASPMETALVLLLCLPVSRGGFGLPFPELNAPIDPGLRKIATVKQYHFYCDLFWKQANLAVEYDGEEFHTGLEHIAHDADRRNDLHHLGVTVLSVTKQQIYDSDGLQRLASQIAGCLGVRLRYKEAMPKWEYLHQDLRRELLFKPDTVNTLGVTNII